MVGSWGAGERWAHYRPDNAPKCHLEGVHRARLDPGQPFVDRLHLRVAERERAVADCALGVGRHWESLLPIDLEILDLVQVGLRIALALNLRDSLSEKFL